MKVSARTALVYELEDYPYYSRVLLASSIHMHTHYG